MTRCYPCLRVHEDSTVKTYVVLALLYEFFTPCGLDVVLQLNAERSEIPCVCKSSVYLTAGIYKASALTESDQLIHGFFCVFHVRNFLSCFAFKSSARRIIFNCKLTMGARFDGSASCRAFGRAASASVPRRDGGYRPSSLSGATPLRLP